jgi:hypothetical protein
MLNYFLIFTLMAVRSTWRGPSIGETPRRPAIMAQTSVN